MTTAVTLPGVERANEQILDELRQQPQSNPLGEPVERPSNRRGPDTPAPQSPYDPRFQDPSKSDEQRRKEQAVLDQVDEQRRKQEADSAILRPFDTYASPKVPRPPFPSDPELGSPALNRALRSLRAGHLARIIDVAHLTTAVLELAKGVHAAGLMSSEALSRIEAGDGTEQAILSGLHTLSGVAAHGPTWDGTDQHAYLIRLEREASAARHVRAAEADRNARREQDSEKTEIDGLVETLRKHGYVISKASG